MAKKSSAQPDEFRVMKLHVPSRKRERERVRFSVYCRKSVSHAVTYLGFFRIFP